MLAECMCAHVGTHMFKCLCVTEGGTGNLLFNAPQYHISHTVITVYRAASAENSHPVPPLPFNLAYFIEQQKYHSPKPRQALLLLLIKHYNLCKFLACSTTFFQLSLF